MSSNPRRQPTLRARPVAEAPVGALLARADELARRWIAALILARPLERIAELPLQKLAGEAPALCGQVIRALESDAELERITNMDAAYGRGDAFSANRLRALAGAGDAQSAVEAVGAVEALRGVLWEAILEESRWPTYDRAPTRQVADLSDRLAYVCATILAAIVAAAAPEEEAVEAQAAEAAGKGPGRGAGDSHGLPIGPRGAILIDEHEEAAAPSGQGVDFERRSPEVEQAHPTHAHTTAHPTADPTPAHPTQAYPTQAGPTKARPLPWDVAPSPSAARGGASRSAMHSPQIEVRDERGEEGPAAWIDLIERQLERFEQDQLPFAVLLVELGDVERLRRAALPGGVSSLTSRIERALAHELGRLTGRPRAGAGRPAGSLTCERPGRYWLLLPETDAFAARRLAEWVERTVGPLAGPHWLPLEVAVGTAVCPDDGREAAALASHADLGLHSVRTSGR